VFSLVQQLPEIINEVLKEGTCIRAVQQRNYVINLRAQTSLDPESGYPARQIAETQEPALSINSSTISFSYNI
jgi:hypothetical protein